MLREQPICVYIYIDIRIYIYIYTHTNVHLERRAHVIMDIAELLGELLQAFCAKLGAATALCIWYNIMYESNNEDDSQW